MRNREDDLNVFKYNLHRNPLIKLKTFFRTLKYAYQRATRGYCDTDVWDMDWYLSNIISRMLLHLSEHHMGYPMEWDEEAWTENLRNAAIDLYDGYYDSEEYEDTLDELFDERRMAMGAGETEQVKEIDKEINRVMRENSEEKEKSKQRALAWIMENWDNLWD